MKLKQNLNIVKALRILFICLILLLYADFAEAFPIFKINSLTDTLARLKTEWIVCTEDNPKFAFSDFDDGKWKAIESLPDYLSDLSTPNGIKWFKLYIEIDSSLMNSNYLLTYYFRGAMEIYFDGVPISNVGEISTTYENQKNWVKNGISIPIHFINKTHYVITIRYSYYNNFGNLRQPTRRLSISICDSNYIQEQQKTEILFYFIFILLAGVMFALGFLHLLIFFFYKKERENLLFFVFVFVTGVFLLNVNFKNYIDSYAYFCFSYIAEPVSLLSIFFFLHRLSYSFFSKMKLWLSVSIIALSIISIVVFYLPYNLFIIILIFLLVISIDTCRVLISALINRKPYAYIIGTGMFIFIGLLAFVIITDNFTKLMSEESRIVLIYSGFLALPISMSIYLARKITHTTVDLGVQLEKVQELSVRTLEQEREKKQILENQNIELEKQVKERTIEIVEKNEILQNQNEEILSQKEEIQTQLNLIVEKNDEIGKKNIEIEKKNKDITSSIMYASRIQRALLPSLSILNNHFPNHFVFWNPKDIVSGDFYFSRKINEFIIIAAADCTGHGVPGAFMSMLGITLLNEIIQRNEIQNASKSLDELRILIKKSLNQTGQTGEQQDGMDIAFCAINTETLQMSFAGAHNPCWIFRNEKSVMNPENQLSINNYQLSILEADHMPVGVYVKEKEFTEQLFQLQKDDVIYIFSDGYHSQFGGNANSKYKTKRMKEFLQTICHKTMAEQKDLLEKDFYFWKGDNEQTDDVLVVGIKI